MGSVNVLERLARSKAAGVGKWIDAPGKYRFQVLKLSYDPNGFKGPVFVAELKVVSAKNTGAKALKLVSPADTALTEIEVPLHEVGDVRSFVTVLDDKNESTYNGVMAFLEALTGLKGGDGEAEGEIDANGILELTGKEQPMKGKYIDDDVFMKPQAKNKTKPFTVHKWITVPAEEQGKPQAAPTAPATDEQAEA